LFGTIRSVPFGPGFPFFSVAAVAASKKGNTRGTRRARRLQRPCEQAFLLTHLCRLYNVVNLGPGFWFREGCKWKRGSPELNVLADFFQDVKDLQLNSKWLSDVIIYDHPCKAIKSMAKDHSGTFPTLGKVPRPLDGASDDSDAYLQHLRHLSPVFNPTLEGVKPTGEPPSKLSEDWDKLERFQLVLPDALQKAANLLGCAATDVQTPVLFESLLEAVGAAPKNLSKPIGPIFIQPPNSKRPIQAGGPINPNGSRRAHPYSGNQQELVCLNNTSHNSNHVKTCQAVHDPKLLQPILSGVNLEVVEHKWARDMVHIPQETGMSLAHFFAYQLYSTNNSNAAINKKHRENFEKTASAHGLELSEDEYGRLVIAKNKIPPSTPKPPRSLKTAHGAQQLCNSRSRCPPARSYHLWL
jgi:hypothetical protein